MTYQFKSSKFGSLHVLFFVLAYLCLLALYATVGYYSTGFDDEFTNLKLVEKLGSKVMAYTQTADVHPPGSYFLNWVLYALFQDWSLVRLVDSIFSASCFVYGIEYARQKYGTRAGVLAFVFLGLNPALLMWCTSVRWYAYFVPVLVWLSVTPKASSRWYWPKLFFGLVVLAYIGYAAFFIAPAVLTLYWCNSTDERRDKLKSVAIFGTVAALAYGYQFFVFITVHLGSKESQVGSVVRSVIGYAIAEVSNQGVFPLSIGGVATAIGSTGIFIIGLVYAVQRRQAGEFLFPYWLGVAGLLISGLAGKFRNFVVVAPFHALWFATLAVDKRKQRYFFICAASLAVGNVMGVYNVAKHQDTMKNSWNLPDADLIQHLTDLDASCAHKMVVFVHDVKFSHVAEQRGFATMGPNATRLKFDEVANQKYTCIAVVKTYAGGMDQIKITAMYRSIAALSFHSTEVIRLGQDDNYLLKKRFDPTFPEYQVELTLIRDPLNLTQLSSWAPDTE
jgi:uncharacterized membrane protein